MDWIVNIDRLSDIGNVWMVELELEFHVPFEDKIILWTTYHKEYEFKNKITLSVLKLIIFLNDTRLRRKFLNPQSHSSSYRALFH